MRWLTRILLRFRSLFRRTVADGELDSELRFHVERQTAANIAAGMPSAEARRQAILEFGGVEQLKEECRQMRKVNWLQDFAQDVRFGLRMLCKSPGFTVVAVLTLALGIGANTAIFSVVNAVLLRSLPYTNPGQLVFVPEANPKQGISGSGMSYPSFSDLRDHGRVFSAIAGLASHALVLTGLGEPSEVSTVVVTPDFFTLFESKPLLGRAFLPEDGERGAAPVVVLNENLWRSRFGADPKILGSSITLDKRPYTVVGVMPAGFRTPFFDQTSQLWIPLAQDPLFSVWMTRPPQQHWLPVIARLRPGMSFTQAQADLDTTSAHLAKEIPAESGWQIGIEPLQQTIVGDAKSPLIILLCAIGLVLLIACANIANLLLTRATSRSKEIAVRIALGADKQRIARQLLTESAILGIFGGVAGILLAYWGVSTLISFLPPGLPRAHSVRVDGAVLGFALLLSLAASVAFGLAPVLFAVSSDPQSNLREGGRAGEARSSHRARSLLAIAEMALAMVLLVGAGLLLRSFAQLTSVSPGFDPTRVVKAVVSLPQYQYSTPRQWAAFSSELMTRLQSEPGLQNSAITAPLPILDVSISLPFTVVGAPPLPRDKSITADYVAASPSYFHVMGIPLMRGRLFNSNDSYSAPPVTIVSEAFAKRYFPNQDPMGRQLTFEFPPSGKITREIVGVVADIRDVALAKSPGPMMYVPFAQAPFWGGEVVVKSELSVSAVAAAIRAETHGIDKDLPVTDISSLPDDVKASVAQPRFRTWGLSLFGAMALVLAAVGIFGVVSYSVSRRTHEIGIRMALGATPASVQRLVLRESAKLVFFGLAIGIPSALVLTRFMSVLLFAVRPADPLTFIGVALLMTLVALAASFIPARRAMKVDPMVALRYE